MKIKIKKLYEDAQIPTKAHKDDIGFDLYSYSYVNLWPNQIAKVKCGFSIELPSNWEAG